MAKNLKILNKIINLLPDPYKFGPLFFIQLRELNRTEFLTPKEIEKEQNKKLAQLLAYSKKYSPYYQKLFKQNKIEGLKDFDKIPFLTKKIYDQNRDQILVKNLNRLFKNTVTTGGTSGKQTIIYNNYLSSASKEWAFICKLWQRVGYNPFKSKRVVIRNDVLGKKLFEYNKNSRTLNINAFNISFDKMGKIIDIINKSKIEYLHLYPSSAYLLAKYIELKNHKINHKIKAILCSSENLYKDQRKFIEKMLNTRVFSWYGHSEQCVLAGECEFSNYYHIFPEYGYVELVDKNGKIIKEPNKQGEIVATSFINNITPFIRYKTGDFAEYAETTSCRCRRNYKMIKNIIGRWKGELFVGRNKNFVSMTAVNEHSEIFNNIERYQFFQEKVGEVTLNIMKTKDYNEKTQEPLIYKRLKQKFGKDFDLKIKYVKKIPLTVSGKHKYLIQKLDVDKLIG